MTFVSYKMFHKIKKEVPDVLEKLFQKDHWNIHRSPIPTSNHKAMDWLGKLTQQERARNESLLLLSLFTTENGNLIKN